MKSQNIFSPKIWLMFFVTINFLFLSACSTIPLEGSDNKYVSQHNRSTHIVDGFDVRSVTKAPEQILLMFRINVDPKEAFQLVSDAEKLATWFTDIENPAMDNTNSNRGPNAIGVNSVRSCSLDGEYLYEDIVHYDDKNLSYAYAIDMEKSTLPFPISNQMSMFIVESDNNGGSLITWRHYFDKNFHITAPILNFAMKNMILKPAVENLFNQYGGEWVRPIQA